MTDPKTVRIVVASLALVVLGALAGAVALAAVDKVLPDLVANMGTAALGALAAVLASTKTQAGPEVDLAQQAGRGQVIEELSALGTAAPVKAVAKKRP